MKVKFLDSGRQAHLEVNMGQFEYKEGEVMSGLSEETAMSMKKAGHVEILGEDDVEEEVSEDKAPKSDATITTVASGNASENDSNGGEKPWNKNGE